MSARRYVEDSLQQIPLESSYWVGLTNLLATLLAHVLPLVATHACMQSVCKQRICSECGMKEMPTVVTHCLFLHILNQFPIFVLDLFLLISSLYFSTANSQKAQFNRNVSVFFEDVRAHTQRRLILQLMPFGGAVCSSACVWSPHCMKIARALRAVFGEQTAIFGGVFRISPTPLTMLPLS